MVKYPTILGLPQRDINRQLFEMIIALQKEQGVDTTALEEAIDALEGSVDDLEEAIGDEATANSILGRIKALESAQG